MHAKVSLTKLTVLEHWIGVLSSAAHDRDGGKELKVSVEKIGQRFLICMRYNLRLRPNFNMGIFI